ncbi:MAG: ATP-dependent zinc metalloprotease FtsH [Patescibacteria group bacterium]
MKSSPLKNLLILILVTAILAVVYSFWAGSRQPITDITISELVQEIKDKKVKEVIIKGNRLDITLNDDSKQRTFKESNVSLTEYGVNPTDVPIKILDAESSAIWISLISSILPFLLIVGFLWFMLRQAQSGNNQAMSFGKSSARIANFQKKRITFADVAGAAEAKEELQEIIEFLKNPQKFLKLGAEIPKGVMLFGPPGSGKTLIAKAVAGEAGVPFFSISGSEFVEMFVGVGASRVRDLFTKAKKNAPCIIFIDEIDAVGRQRGAGLGGSHDEREQTLNQILVEMDGFETDTNVIVMAATNRPDVLDPALLRPGRFDRRIYIGLPDIKDREAILKVHARNKPISKTVDLATIAKKTPGFSGADIRNLLNEAALLTARHNKTKITQEQIDQSLEKVTLGPEKKNKILTKKEKEITAYHEAGHALVAHLLPNCDPVHKVSIIARGMALGVTWFLPEEDRHLYSKEKFIDDMASALGGRLAEEIVFKDITTGAENDLQQVSRIARKMVKLFGMSTKLGPITFGQKDEMVFLGRDFSEQKNYSEETASEIDKEVSNFIQLAYQKAKQTIIKNRPILDKISQKLLEVETIDENDFAKLFPKNISKLKTSV